VIQQVNSISTPFDVFLDLDFSNYSADITIETSVVPLLKQDRHHKAYEISVDIFACWYEPCPDVVERYKFASADFESISEELN
jgi:hypothetical protein